MQGDVFNHRKRYSPFVAHFVGHERYEMNSRLQNTPVVTPPSNEIVTVTLEGRIAVITTANPPVNAISHGVRTGLVSTMAPCANAEDIDAIILACDGRTFFAGADINEFGKPAQTPTLREVICFLERFPKPVIAAIHGTALGGGLELALGCHFRIAHAEAKLGLPEVRLGLIPGSGGTVRMTHLLGPEAALKLIATGISISAQQARALNLLDDISDRDVLEEALDFARALTSEGPVRENRWDRVFSADEIERFDLAAQEVARKSRQLEAPLACIEAIRNATRMSFEEAMVEERKIFERLMSGAQSKAQRHLFLAERAASKVSDLSKTVSTPSIRSVGIVGAGTMGAGIATTFINADIPVKLWDVNADVLSRGRASIEKSYDLSVSRGSMTADDKETRLQLLSTAANMRDFSDVDLVIEAVIEDMPTKLDVFHQLDGIVGNDAILATNTSYLDVNTIAQATSRPENVLGLHFFSPANVMKLVEIVRARETSHKTLAAGLDLSKKLKKIPVVVGVGHGFVGNRMLAARNADTQNLLLDGATPEQVDEAFTEFGWPMGPFAMGDLAGLDVSWRNRKALGQTAPIADALCERGRFGQKTGAGYYLYEAGSRKPKVDPAVLKLIEGIAYERGISRRDISNEEIIERTHFPMVNEGYKLFGERIAARLSDIDVVWVNGYGFPTSKGGPMYWATQDVGLDMIASRLKYWHDRTSLEPYRVTGAFGSADSVER